MKKVTEIKPFIILMLCCVVIFSACKSSSSENVTPKGGGTGGVNPPARSSEVMINGYIPDWLSSGVYSSFDYANMTIAYFAFVVCDANGNLNSGGTTKENKMATVISSAHAVGTKVYLSFGGGAYYGSQVFYDMARIESSRKEFAHQVKDFCLAKGFDGFDVDWEGLGNASEGLAHEALMKTLKDTLHSVGLGLAVTVQQGANAASNFTYTGINQADLVQIMSYDATGTWSGSPVGQHSSYSFAEDGINYWSTTRGIAKSKLVLGVPFYGYKFGSTIQTITYKSIISNYPTISDDVDYIDNGVYNGTYFNGYQTLIDKISMAYTKNIPGIMIWEMSQDASGSQSLLTRMKDFLVANNLSVKKLENSIP
jgi:chitinase